MRAATIISVLSITLYGACSREGSKLSAGVALDTPTSNLYSSYQQASTSTAMQAFAKQFATVKADALLARAVQGGHLKEYKLGGVSYIPHDQDMQYLTKSLRYIDKTFGSIPAYWASVGFKPQQSVSLDEFKLGVASLDKSQKIARGELTGAAATMSSEEKRSALQAFYVVTAVATMKRVSQVTGQGSVGLNLYGPQVSQHLYCSEESHKGTAQCPGTHKKDSGASGSNAPWSENCAMVDGVCQIISAAYSTAITAQQGQTTQAQAGAANAAGSSAAIEAASTNPPPVGHCTCALAILPNNTEFQGNTMWYCVVSSVFDSAGNVSARHPVFSTTNSAAPSDTPACTDH